MALEKAEVHCEKPSIVPYQITVLSLGACTPPCFFAHSHAPTCLPGESCLCSTGGRGGSANVRIDCPAGRRTAYKVAVQISASTNSAARRQIAHVLALFISDHSQISGLISGQLGTRHKKTLRNVFDLETDGHAGAAKRYFRRPRAWMTAGRKWLCTQLRRCRRQAPTASLIPHVGEGVCQTLLSSCYYSRVVKSGPKIRNDSQMKA
jgi:hypothetical protein